MTGQSTNDVKKNAQMVRHIFGRQAVESNMLQKLQMRREKIKDFFVVKPYYLDAASAEVHTFLIFKIKK